MTDTPEGKAVVHPVILVSGSLRPRWPHISVHHVLYREFPTILVYLTTLCPKIKKNKRNKNDFPVLCCNLFSMKSIQQRGIHLWSACCLRTIQCPRGNKTDSTGKEVLSQKPSVTMTQNRMKHGAVSLKQVFSTVHPTTNIKSKCGYTEQWEYYSLTGHKRGQKIRGAGTVELETTD